LIKGYGRALVREKVVAAASRQLVILVGEEKLVPMLGTRGKVPIEVVPFAAPLCLMKTTKFAPMAELVMDGEVPLRTDNGNYMIDLITGQFADAAALDRGLRDIPGVVDTGLFLDMASVVLVGDDKTFELRTELRRP
jgi:ribose 5-phosphate isomerase A